MSDRKRVAACHFAEGLFTDLYELTMAQAYQAEAMSQAAVFEVFGHALIQQAQSPQSKWKAPR